MTSLHVDWNPSSIQTLMDLLENDCHGVLTTDHALSSRGLPVVVADDGAVLGPADVPELYVATYVETDDVAGRDIHRTLTAEEEALIEAARSAGYVVRTGGPL